MSPPHGAGALRHVAGYLRPGRRARGHIAGYLRDGRRARGHVAGYLRGGRRARGQVAGYLRGGGHDQFTCRSRPGKAAATQDEHRAPVPATRGRTTLGETPS
ncbi:hypothetical protein GCM10027047_33470 [Rhodococcus aerolatus]